MNARFLFPLLGLALLTAAPAAYGVDARRGPAVRAVATGYTDRLIVRFRLPADSERRQPMSAARVRALGETAGVPLAPLRTLGDGAQVLALQRMSPLGDVRRMAARLAGEPDVEYAEPDYRRFAQAVPNDPRFGTQWHLFEPLGGINAPAAWDVTTGSAAITVAVLDTGVVFFNRELAGRLFSGHDFVGADPSNDCAVGTCPFATANDGSGRDADPSDPGNWVSAVEAGRAPFQECTTATDSDWHGTHVTGIIAANANNGDGIAGLDWNAGVLPVRVLGKCAGYVSDIADGIRWAAGLPVPGVPANAIVAQVLNLSLGAAGRCSQTEQAAISAALNTGRVKAIVVSAGNTGGDADNTAPGNCTRVISVGATTRGGSLASYSDRGAAITLMAPGGFITDAPGDDGSNGILSLFNTGLTGPVADAYAFFGGTSAAAAQVSGVVALMLAVNPNLSADQVRRVLTASARAFPDASCSTATCGAGIVDAAAAVRLAPTPPAPPPAPPSSGGGGGGGGCTTGAGGSGDAALSLLALGALLGLARRRR